MKTHEETLRIVCDYLNRHDVSYVVVGGLAVMYHGVPRTTVDIDFILRLDRSQSESLVSFLELVGFSVSLQDMLAAFSERSHCTALALDSPLRIDIQGVYSEFDRLTLERAVDAEFAGTRVRLGSVEDTLANKILFGSEQDLRDALGIYIRHSNNLDYTYVERVCQLLAITAKWNRFLSAAKKKLRDGAYS